MSDWTTTKELRLAVEKLWSRGLLLTATWKGHGLELPYRITLKGPSSSEWSEKFADSRAWIASLEGLPLVWREFTHPRLGRNRVPSSAEWGTVDELLVFIGRRNEARRFCKLADLVVARFPVLEAWVGRYPHRLLNHEPEVERLLVVAEWMVRHPRPGLYLRQVDVAGVHTKFLESHRALLSEWFDLVLPPEQINTDHRGAAQFASRYGFLEKPRMIRFRPLDSRIPGPRDMAWTLDDWARWAEPPRRLVITENEINYLSLPELADSWAVFGAGYGFEGWSQAAWLAEAELWYWGDLDTHGFAILDQLRAIAPHARSVFMDEQTLLAHRGFWGREPDPADRALTRLTAAEQTVYRGLVEGLWGQALRLEQEHLGFEWVQSGFSSF